MDADLLDDLLADLVDGIQRAHRVLEDHRDPGASDLAQLVLGRGDEVVPSNVAPPSNFAFGPRVSPISVIAVTVLPDPDSPTIATTSPGSTVNETPSTARTIPSSVWN